MVYFCFVCGTSSEYVLKVKFGVLCVFLTGKCSKEEIIIGFAQHLLGLSEVKVVKYSQFWFLFGQNTVGK